MQNIFSSESSPNAPPQSIPIQQLAPAQQSANIQPSANEMEEFESYSNMPIHQSMRIQQSKPIGEFYLPSNITTFNDGVRWYIETWFSDLLTRLQEKIVTPVMQVEIKLDGIKDIDLPNVTQQAIKDGLKDSRNHLEKLNARLDSLESPLGRIPADLPDLIKLFPIIMGIFVRASLLVIAEPDLFKLLTSNEVDFMRRNIFIGTYIFGVLIIFGCLWFIGKIFK